MVGKSGILTKNMNRNSKFPRNIFTATKLATTVEFSSRKNKQTKFKLKSFGAKPNFNSKLVP